MATEEIAMVLKHFSDSEIVRKTKKGNWSRNILLDKKWVELFMK